MCFRNDGVEDLTQMTGDNPAEIIQDPFLINRNKLKLINDMIFLSLIILGI